MKRNILALVLCLTLLTSLIPSARAEEAYDDYDASDSVMGNPLADFTVETIDGGTFSLSQAIAEKGLVFINLWATWCGPCGTEFPYLQKAYELYQDRVAVIALSVETADSPDVLRQYADARGLTFPIGSDSTIGLSDYFSVTAIPSSLLVDRFGNVAWMDVGAQTSTDAFTRLFDWFLREDYTETEVLDGVPPMKPSAEPMPETALNNVLNAPGGKISFRNADDPYTWPMLTAEKDGRRAVAPSNTGHADSAAAVIAQVTAQEGDALAFDFATSTESGGDLMTVILDGEQAKAFGGEHPWTTWVIDLTPGDHEIEFRYAKDAMRNGGADCVWLDEVRLVSGEEADALRAGLPSWPTGDSFGLTVTAPDAREIVFEGNDAIVIPYYMGTEIAWIVPEDSIEVGATLTADQDPDAAFFLSDYDGATRSAWDSLTADGEGYLFSSKVDTLYTTGYPWTEIYLYPDSKSEAFDAVLFFADEENVDAFLSIFTGDMGADVSWRYADGSLPENADAEPKEEDATSSVSRYTISFVDQNGDPVPGCIVNFCTDDACTPVVADENGQAAFEGAPYAYHLQVIRVPAGYAFDTAQEFSADPAGGEIMFTVTKE